MMTINRLGPTPGLLDVGSGATEAAPSAGWVVALRAVVETAVVERPKTILLTALAAGALLGWIVKRR